MKLKTESYIRAQDNHLSRKVFSSHLILALWSNCYNSKSNKHCLMVCRFHHCMLSENIVLISREQVKMKRSFQRLLLIMLLLMGKILLLNIHSIQAVIEILKLNVILKNEMV